MKQIGFDAADCFWCRWLKGVQLQIFLLWQLHSVNVKEQCITTSTAIAIVIAIAIDIAIVIVIAIAIVNVIVKAITIDIANCQLLLLSPFMLPDQASRHLNEYLHWILRLFVITMITNMSWGWFWLAHCRKWFVNGLCPILLTMLSLLLTEPTSYNRTFSERHNHDHHDQHCHAQCYQHICCTSGNIYFDIYIWYSDFDKCFNIC